MADAAVDGADSTAAVAKRLASVGLVPWLLDRRSSVPRRDLVQPADVRREATGGDVAVWASGRRSACGSESHVAMCTLRMGIRLGRTDLWRD